MAPFGIVTGTLKVFQNRFQILNELDCRKWKIFTPVSTYHCNMTNQFTLILLGLFYFSQGTAYNGTGHPFPLFFFVSYYCNLLYIIVLHVCLSPFLSCSILLFKLFKLKQNNMFEVLWISQIILMYTNTNNWNLIQHLLLQGCELL